LNGHISGEEELIDRWMKTPTYAPVQSIQQMENEARHDEKVRNNKFS
jgi:hypothetical protein